jgi:AcrR family transcriptional regulator
MKVAKRRLQDEARRVKNDLYRQHILEAAEHVFAERGFESAKLSEISATADLSMGTIYAIFPGKEDLFRAILEERGHELLQVARSVAAPELTPTQALDALIEAYIDYFVDHPGFLRMYLRLGTSWVLGPSLGTESQLRLWTEIHALQAGIFRRGVEQGVFADEDPAFLAKIFSAVDQVLLAEWAAGGMKADRAALTDRFRRIIQRAVLASEGA